MKKLFLAIFLISIIFSGCDDESSGNNQNNVNNIQPGEEGGPCYPNNTCNQGLECIEDICVSEDATPQEGEEGGPCLEGDLCNGTLECVNDICIDPDTTPGEEGGPCLEGDQCNEGLVCHEDICKTDADGDGYPAALDCDDSDETVYPGTILQCTSACAYGTRSCNSQGEWTACTASTDCECSQAGDTRTMDCGKCGTATVLCTADLIWEFPENCEDEGVCYPWEGDTQECGNCGTQDRTCNASCQWNGWESCTGEGDCIAGFVGWLTDDCTPLGHQAKYIECDENCQYIVNDGCTDDAACSGQPRTGTTNFSDEVCIPGGPFIRGNDEDNDDGDAPEGVVFLTPYYIDVYEVTISRYKECVAAGFCNDLVFEESVFFDAEAFYNDPANGDRPVFGVPREKALAFCNWDGGRTLPTEAQWEKAAKGPYPEQKIYTWGNEDIEDDCTYVILSGCFGDVMSSLPGPVNYATNGLSFYGLYSMEGNVGEHVFEYYDADLYNLNIFIDPQGPLTGTQWGYRGDDIKDTNAWGINERYQITPFTESGPNSYGFHSGFRCARQAW